KPLASAFTFTRSPPMARVMAAGSWVVVTTLSVASAGDAPRSAAAAAKSRRWKWSLMTCLVAWLVRVRRMGAQGEVDLQEGLVERRCAAARLGRAALQPDGRELRRCE